MATLTEQERAQEQAWRQRQAASTTLPDYVTSGREARSDDGADESEQDNQEPESVEDEDQTKRALYQEQLSNQKQLAVQQQAAQEQLQEEAESGGEAGARDNNILFFAALYLALIKDLLDLIGIETFGLLGTFVNIFISGAFALILFLRGSKLSNNKAIIRYIIAGIAEFIPIVNLLPMWTVSVLWEKLEKKLPASMQVVSKVAGDNKQQNLTAGEHGAIISGHPGYKRDASSAQDDSDEDMKMAA